MKTRQDAIERYIEIAGRLPAARFPEESRRADNLAELTDEIDAFVLDGFGVLNVGGQPVEGAVERVRQLRDAGKQVIVLTNGATMPAPVTVAKYARWGYPFPAEAVVSSRDALSEALQNGPYAEVGQWGFAASSESQIERLQAHGLLLGDKEADYDRVDGFVLLSTAEWNDERQALLSAALESRPRPVLVGNPDLVAPWEGGLSIEPGQYAHRLQDAGLADPAFYGKPFQQVFEIAARRLDGIEPSRIVMVGDTLHTDILGGAAFGWRSALVVDHGLMRDADLVAVIVRSGIRPDFIVRTT